jgi:uncharacterized protein (TIRG00374 family)
MTEAAREQAPHGRLRRVVGSTWLRVGVTVGLLAIVASQIDWAAMEGRVRNGHPEDFALAVVALVLALGVGAWRWQLLLRDADLELGVAQLLRIYAVSSFSNTFLPAAVGGDVARALLVARRGPLLTRAALTVIVDRAGALAGLVGLAWLAYALDPGTVPGGATTFLVWVTAVTAVAAVATGLTVLRGAGAVRRIVPERLLSIAREAHSVLHSYARSPRLLAALLVSSVVFQALVAFQLVMLAHAIDVELSFAAAAVALALVTIVTLIPVSIGGFGLREASYVVLLDGAGISATDATLISVLSVAALFFATLPGAYQLARGGVPPALEAAPR